jgi:hypothetical protein
MSSAGQKLVAGRVPGERIATNINTANTGAITTEAVTDTIANAPLVSGRTYRIKFVGSIQGGAAERVLVRIREDNVSGTVLNTFRVGIPSATNYGAPPIEAEYTAVATGNKTFVITMQRETAVATTLRVGNATQPAYAYVDYIRG